jgi:SAM-dependent methyltransferase
VECSVCQSTALRFEPYYYLWLNRRWVIVRCLTCTHGFVFPHLSAREQGEIYHDNYFSAGGDWVEGVWALGYFEAESKLRDEAREVLGMIDRNGGQLLEVGCAGGYFLDEARKWGFDVLGIELNRTMATRARDALGLDVIEGRLEDINPGRFADRFDTIVLMDVLEHIPQPRTLIETLTRWLRPDGLIFVRGPVHNDPLDRLKAFVRRVAQVEKRLPGYPLDSNFFTPHSLATLLMEHGYRDLRWFTLTRGFGNILARRTRTG